MVKTISAISAGRKARDLLVAARDPDGGYRMPSWPEAGQGQSDSAAACRAVVRLRVVQRTLVGFLDPVEGRPLPDRRVAANGVRGVVSPRARARSRGRPRWVSRLGAMRRLGGQHLAAGSRRIPAHLQLGVGRMRCDIDVRDGELGYRGDIPGEHSADLAMTASPTEFELARLAPAAAPVYYRLGRGRLEMSDDLRALRPAGPRRRQTTASCWPPGARGRSSGLWATAGGQ